MEWLKMKENLVEAPFWVKGLTGYMFPFRLLSRPRLTQMIPEQKEIFDGSTHFNPVDIVCGVRSYQRR